MSTEDDANATTTKKGEQILTQPEPEPKDDLMDLNADAETINDDGALVQPGEADFDPGDYGGFPMEAWQRYLGAINDKRQSRAASLATYLKFKVRYNVAPPTIPYPDFKVLELTYYPITKKVWETRRKDLAEIEDMERQLQAQVTKLAETQESLRLRIFNRNKPRGMVTNREDPNKAVLEEIQTNMKFFQEFESGIGKRVAEMRQHSDSEAFTMYFHKDKNTYEQIMNEDIDDILRACDWKQVHGTANLRLSKALSSQSNSPGTA
jgi:hypothetical protein